MAMVAPNHQVLVVDDHAGIRDAFATILRLAGFDVAPAWGVEDALRQLHEGFQPCVALVDLHMPEMDGWDFLDRLQVEPHLTDARVVIVSGDAEERDEVERAGCGFLLKPVLPAALVATVGEQCRRH